MCGVNLYCGKMFDDGNGFAASLGGGSDRACYRNDGCTEFMVLPSIFVNCAALPVVVSFNFLSEAPVIILWTMSMVGTRGVSYMS